MSSNSYLNLINAINQTKSKNIQNQIFFLYQLPSKEYLFIANISWLSNYGLIDITQSNDIVYSIKKNDQLKNLIVFLKKSGFNFPSKTEYLSINTDELKQQGLSLFKIPQEIGDKILDIINPSVFDNPNIKKHSREIEFGFHHPWIAYKNGLKIDEKSSNNLASIIQRFADAGASKKELIPVLTNKGKYKEKFIGGFGGTSLQYQHRDILIPGRKGKKGLPFETEGTEVNAFRHALWNTVFTNWYGKAIARDIANSHEDNPRANDTYVDIEGNIYPNMNEADQAVDLANNQIGRRLGGSYQKKSIKELAFLLLDEFYNHGLYTVRKNNNNQFETYRKRISSQEYNYMREVYTEVIDENGHLKGNNHNQKLDLINKKYGFSSKNYKNESNHFEKDDIVLFPDKYQKKPLTNPSYNPNNNKRGSNDFELLFSKKTVMSNNNFISLSLSNIETFKSIHKDGQNIKKKMDNSVNLLHNYFKEAYLDLNLNQTEKLQKQSDRYGNALLNDTRFHSYINQTRFSFNNTVDKKNINLLPLSKQDIKTYQQIQKVGNKIKNEANDSILLLYPRYKHDILSLHQTQKEKAFNLPYQLDNAVINRPRFKNQPHQTIIQNKYSTIVQQQPVQTSQEIQSGNISKHYRSSIIDSINSSII